MMNSIKNNKKVLIQMHLFARNIIKIIRILIKNKKIFKINNIIWTIWIIFKIIKI